MEKFSKARKAKANGGGEAAGRAKTHNSFVEKSVNEKTKWKAMPKPKFIRKPKNGDNVRLLLWPTAKVGTVMASCTTN